MTMMPARDAVPPRLRWCRGGRAARARLVTAFTVLAAALPPLPAAAQEASIAGRVMDRTTGEGVADATVELEGSGFLTASDRQGFFRFARVPAGAYLLRVQHIGYGEFRDSVTLRGADGGVAVRIQLARAAIQLEPMVVEVLSNDERDRRSRGTRLNLVTRRDIERALGTSQHVGNVLASHVPGVRVRGASARLGGPVCVEFRTPASLVDPLGCKTPVVIVDGARVADPTMFWGTMPLDDLERIEVLAPGEAGVLYGSDSRFGVVLVQTRTGMLRAPTGHASDLLGTGVYDWAVEDRPHDWTKVFAVAFVANAAAVALGVAAARRCMDFTSLSDAVFNPRCDPLATNGARVAAMVLPMASTSLAARYAGSTELSRGKLGHAVAATALALAPGYVLSATGEDDGFRGARLAGGLLVLVGSPAGATLADRLFRRVRGR